MDDPHSARRATLHILTTDPTTAENAVVLPCPDICDGSYTCICQYCVAQRMSLVKRGVRPIPQPVKRTRLKAA